MVTSHYAYSVVEGFGTKAYNTSGLSLNVLYDTRDSTINAYRGVYASRSYQWNPTWFGSSKDSSLLSAELRTYIGLSSAVPRNVLAFWVVFANLSTFTRPAVSYLGYTEAGESLFEHPRVAGGVGLRIMQNRQSRTNITLDLTVAEKTVGFYFGAGEAF